MNDRFESPLILFLKLPNHDTNENQYLNDNDSNKNQSVLYCPAILKGYHGHSHFLTCSFDSLVLRPLPVFQMLKTGSCLADFKESLLACYASCERFCLGHLLVHIS